MNTKLNPENVRNTLIACLYEPEEVPNNVPPEDSIKVDGIVSNFFFNPEKIEKNKETIIEMLSELHKNFKEGWSFLCLCETKYNTQWTGEQSIMEALMVLGIAIGKVSYLLDREYWSILPGGVPYIILR